MNTKQGTIRQLRHIQQPEVQFVSLLESEGQRRIWQCLLFSILVLLKRGGWPVEARPGSKWSCSWKCHLTKEKQGRTFRFLLHPICQSSVNATHWLNLLSNQKVEENWETGFPATKNKSGRSKEKIWEDRRETGTEPDGFLHSSPISSHSYNKLK